MPAHAVLHADDPLAEKDAVWLADLAQRYLVLLDLLQDGKLIVRLSLLDDLPQPTLLVIDMYAAAKPLFVRVFMETVRDFFRHLGPAGFSVTTRDLARTLLIKPIAPAS